MHEFFIPTGLDGKRDGNRSGIMEGGYEDGTLSLPSPWSYSPIVVSYHFFLSFHRLGAVYLNMEQLFRLGNDMTLNKRVFISKSGYLSRTCFLFYRSCLCTPMGKGLCFGTRLVVPLDPSHACAVFTE